MIVLNTGNVLGQLGDIYSCQHKKTIEANFETINLKFEKRENVFKDPSSLFSFNPPSESSLEEYSYVIVAINDGKKVVKKKDHRHIFQKAYIQAFYNKKRKLEVQESENHSTDKDWVNPLGVSKRRHVDSRGSNAPLDNTICISDEGVILEVTNSRLRLITPTKMETTRSLNTFFDGFLSLPVDPRVYFDNDSKRFFLFAQQGKYKQGDFAKTCLAVSSSDNPFDPWFFYEIVDEQAKLEFDYPRMSISKEEIIISGTYVMEKNSGSSFEERVAIYQLPKNKLIQAGACSMRSWKLNNSNICHLFPVRSEDHAQMNSVPLLIGLSWAEGSNVGCIYSLPKLNVDSKEVHYLEFSKSTLTSPFSYALQRGNQFLDNLDLRVMDAYVDGNQITYVSTNGNNENQSRIELGYIDCSDLCNLKVTSMLLGEDSESSYSFPSISWMNTDEGKMTVVQYCGSNSRDYPAVYCTLCGEKNGTIHCSSEFLLARSEGPLCDEYIEEVHRGKNIKLYRWGDYTTIAAKHDRSGVLLVSSISKAADKGSTSTLVNDLSSSETKLISYLSVPYEVIELPKKFTKSSVDEIKFIIGDELGGTVTFGEDILLSLQRGDAFTILLPVSVVAEDEITIDWIKKDKPFEAEMDIKPIKEAEFDDW